MKYAGMSVTSGSIQTKLVRNASAGHRHET